MRLLPPTNQDNERLFAAFLTHKADKTVFAPKSDNEADQLFSASAASFHDHLRLMENPVNASGAHFSVVFGYAESIIPTAFAGRSDDHHVIGMHTSLPLVIYEFAQYCFAQVSFFPELGNAGIETSSKPVDGVPPGLWLLMQTARGADNILPKTPHCIPHDPYRNAAAHYLTLLMMRFAWLHELAHGMLGHTDYLRRMPGQGKNDNVELNELGLMSVQDPSIKINSKILQCMEFEADSSALARSIAIQINGLENIAGITEMDAPTRYRLTLFGIYAMTWLFEIIATTFQKSRLNITHPAPIRRLQMLQNMAVWELHDLGLDYSGITKDSLRQFERILAPMDSQWKQTDHFDPQSYRATFEEMRDNILTPYRYLVPE